MTTNRKLILFCSFILLAGGQLFAQSNTGDKKVVFIIVDGIAPDMFSSVNTPNLDRITKDGDYTVAYVGGEKGGYSESPTISSVGYNSLLTGVWTNKHNVFGNAIRKPNYNYPTVFRLFKNAYPDKETAIFSTWEDNRTKLVGADLVGTNFLKIDHYVDGLEKDTKAYPHDGESEYIKNIDKEVATQAASYIADQGPDLTWVYLQYTDDMGHKYGDSPQMDAAIEFEDGLLGEIYDAVTQREKTTNEDWLFVVTTDHGRTEDTGKGHGGHSDRVRATWILMNKKGNDYFQNKTPAVVDILPTISEFLELNPSESVKQNWDGVSLLGQVAATNLQAAIENDNFRISWENLASGSEPANIYVSYSNNAEHGAKDEYHLLGEVNLQSETAEFPVAQDSDHYTILLETPSHFLNRWIITKPAE